MDSFSIAREATRYEKDAQSIEVEVTIIVVSYCTLTMTLECLDSIYEQTRATKYEIRAVDNASGDGSADAIAERFPRIRLFAQKENLGFAIANNLAATSAKGKYLLLLNPDTLVLDHAIDRLVAFAREHPDAGIWGGRTLFADGKLNPTSCWGRMTLLSLFFFACGFTRAFHNSRIFNREAMGNWQRDTVRSVDVVTGCFFLIERSLWQRLGGFDPTYFMYGEEADLCLRAHKLGAKPIICPEAQIIHYGSASDPLSSEKRIKVYAGKVTIMRTHWSYLGAKVGTWLLLLACLNRYIGFTIVGHIRGQQSTIQKGRDWRDTFRQRGRWTRGYEKRSL